MYVQMMCSCEAEFAMDTDDNENSAWFLIFRFANAHVGCGYMTDGTSDDEPSKDKKPNKRVIKGRRDDPPEEP